MFGKFCCLIIFFCALVGSVSADPQMASPSEINLKGNIRVATLNSALGRIELRWPRAVEQLFGRTPERATVDAAASVNRALNASSFPTEVQHLYQEWSIVFLDASQPITQVPPSLVNDCHPGWMTPPSNIYIVAQTAANFCGGQRVEPSVADSRLAQVLIHEMGHAVEYQLLKDQFARNRMRAEGFASWFEQYANDYSSVIPRGSIKNYYRSMARSSFRGSSQFSFSGTASDYAQASMFFAAIESRRGVSGVVDLYKRMRTQKVDLMPAIQGEMGWDDRKLSEEVIRLLK